MNMQQVKDFFDMLIYVSSMAASASMPLLIAALGGLFSERSGIVNIGLEGLMLVGSFAAAWFSRAMFPVIGSAAIWWSIPVAMLAAAAFSLLHAAASISLKSNQVISGTAINILAAALTVFIARSVTGSGNISVPMGGLSRFNVPYLSKIPVLGAALFTETYATTWMILAILAVSIFVLYKTPFGLRLRSCGENPHAADAAGISVTRIRYAGVIISGALAGLGGAAYTLCYLKEFKGTVFGLGFLALASLIFGQWKPLGILGATMFFGYVTTFSNVSTIMPGWNKLPSVLYRVFPYVATLIVLVISSHSSAAPRAAGEPFETGKR